MIIVTDIDFKGPYERALIKIENAIVKKMLSNVPPPNAEATVKKKKSSKTLIDSAEMLGHVTHRISDGEAGLVGEVGIFDENISKRAFANEYGVIWAHRPNVRADAENREEDEAREWFIPPRPFLRPAFDETAPKAAEEMFDELVKQIEQKLGW